ncbi:hypothetical protein C6502_03185 [Candidatus Poribacteria bacterium]|nr:MAG: hypothetical protein C6502_03185 [Candidatus Poribacteria bacterium]
MLRYIFAVILSVCAASISEGLEVGDSALETTFVSGDKEIKFADFHGKFNLIVVSDTMKYREFNTQLEQQADTFKAKYDATTLRLQEDSGILLIDKSGYLRWKFLSDAGLAQTAIAELESELVKLKRHNPLPIGSPAPDFGLIDVETGLLFNLSKYKGKKHALVTLLLQTY